MEPLTRFGEWLFTAKPGDAFVYHIGYLPVDRHARFDWHPGKKVDVLAKIVYGHYMMGRCLLVQKRVDEGIFEYIAVKRKEANARAKARP